MKLTKKANVFATIKNGPTSGRNYRFNSYDH